MTDHWAEHTTCRCGRRCRLVTVRPAIGVTGAKAVTGFWCPDCDEVKKK